MRRSKARLVAVMMGVTVISSSFAMQVICPPHWPAGAARGQLPGAMRMLNSTVTSSLSLSAPKNAV